MATTEELLLEIQALKSQLSKQNEELNKKDQELQKQKEKIDALEKENKWYFDQWKLSQRRKFGPSSEKGDLNQLTFDDLFSGMFNEVEAFKEPIAIEPDEKTVIKARTRAKQKRGIKYNNLPVEVVEYKLTGDNKLCDVCGSELTEMKKEVRKELVMIPPKVKVVEHVTYTYYCRNCNEHTADTNIVKAQSPKVLIPKSMVSPSMMSYIISSKFVNSLPLYRQAQDFNRYDVALRRQDLSNWIMKAGKILEPLYILMKQALLENEILHADETTLEVLKEPDKKSISKSYMWVYVTPEYTEKPIIIFDYKRGRSGEYPREFLKEWKGKYLQCDGYTGYKKVNNVELCGCWVHARRKFHDAVKTNNKLAAEGEMYINKLFAIEHNADDAGMTFEQRQLLRNNISKQELEKFYKWIDDNSLKILSKSVLGEAVKYVINQKEYLTSFLKDGRISLSNNLAERTIRPFVVGRKNWLFSNTPSGAETSALLYSITQTALANNLKPYDYLNYIFTEIQMNQDLDLNDLLPWSDKIPASCKKEQSR